MPVHQHQPEIDRLVPLDAEVEWLVEGLGRVADDGRFQGGGEGPVWHQDEQCLLFSDIGNNCRLRWSEQGGRSVDKAPTGNANGMTLDPQGRLVICQHEERRVIREEPDGSITVVADRYRGLKLNRPNDVVVRSDGSIYFTDPITFGVDSETDLPGVYRVSPDLRSINLLVRDFSVPNGIVFSADETTLYVNDTGRRHIRSFTLETYFDSGRLELHTDKVFCQMTGEDRGWPDGMAVDVEENVWCTGPGGIWIVSADGTHLGTLELLGPRAATNLCFGGKDWTTLFITTPWAMGRVQLHVAGLPTPRAPRPSPSNP